MHQGGGSWGHAKHRQGGHGKNADGPNNQNKFLRRQAANQELDEAERLRRGKRRLQEFVPIEEWLKKGRGRK